MSSLPSPIGNFCHADQCQHVWDADENSEGYQRVAGSVDHVMCYNYRVICIWRMLMGMETPGQKIVIEAFEDFDKWCKENSDEIEGLSIEEQVDKYAFFRQINSPSSHYRRQRR